MGLASGTKIGHYQIQSLLGAGGMGEVYRALDSRLKRSVAIKILGSEFSRDKERLGRFKREAQLLASLNHSNIAVIHGLEQADGIDAIVMELVEGKDLSQLVAAGPIAPQYAITLAKQIVDALDTAHQKGIIHRDLKPGNIRITADDRVKLLDFGLSKAVESSSASDPSSSPTLTSATGATVILGTAAYMSPEQARGKPVDKSTDVWSFGCVLFEMVAGRRAFAGDEVTEVLAQVIMAEPDWSLLPAATPIPIRRLLQRCLAKDRKNRLHDISDARLELLDAESGVDAPNTGVDPPWRAWLPWISAAVLSTAVVAAVFFLHPSSPRALRKFQISIPGRAQDFTALPTISPDGKRIAYVAGEQLWVRDLDRLKPHTVPDAKHVQGLFWSPDGNFLAYGADKRLWKVAALGGSSSLICDVPDTGIVISGAWGVDNKLAFSVWRNSVYMVSANGGTPRVLVAINPATEVDLHNLSFLPDGKTLLFTIHHVHDDPERVAAFSGNKRKTLLKSPEGLGQAVYSPPGYLVYENAKVTAANSIWAVPFSASAVAVRGQPFLVAQEADLLGVAGDGTLLYQPNLPVMRQLVEVDSSGMNEHALGNRLQELADPAVAPDGRRIAMVATEDQVHDVWIFNLATGATSHISPPGSGYAAVPVWSPQGDRLALTTINDNSVSGTIWLMAVDGSLAPEEIGKGFGGSFSPDGRLFAYTREDVRGKSEIWYTSMASKQQQRLFSSAGRQGDPQISPDGHLVAYVSDVSGRSQVYVRPFPAGDGEWQVSSNSGSLPRWSADGRELFYIEGVNLTAVEVATRPRFSLGARHKLFAPERFDMASDTIGSPYAVARDGRNFFFLLPTKADERAGTIVLVENWTAEFQNSWR